MAMELFFELVLTLVVSFFCSFILAKLISLANDHDFENKTTHYHNFQPECKDYWETGKKFGFVSEIVGVEEFEELKLAQQQELSSESFGSFNFVEDNTKSHDELIREIEIVDLTEEGCEENSIDKSEIDMGLINEELGIYKDEMNCEIDGIKEGLLDDEEDDWEGIERSELEKRFGAAVAYVGSIDNANKLSSTLSNGLKLQLYGLHQVAIEGPCHLPQPMPLKFSARSKWNAWQQLGNMSPEMAMEQYINLVSTSIPEWMKDAFGDQVRKLHA
uniref:Acyl-CoA binding protein 3A n=1 Tax=Vernicia fordii TaxID=73154 RepID=K9ZS42_VERFO|nr:acyl-CoA binding protein 3A [Vernicia fordii]AFZ62128.1 acyl-CoA binding protein 3A [Vernicia fordii]